MKNLLLVFALLVFLSSQLRINAQNLRHTDSIHKYKHAIGAGAGFTTGYGLSYRYTHTLPKIGIQINFAPYSNENLTRFSSGITFLYTLIESPKANLFLYQGNHYYYNYETIYNDSVSGMNHSNNSNLNNSVAEKIIEKYFNNGLGIGVEFIVIKRISFNLMAGYAAYNNFKYLSFTGETGLYFKF